MSVAVPLTAAAVLLLSACAAGGDAGAEPSRSPFATKASTPTPMPSSVAHPPSTPELERALFEAVQANDAVRIDELVADGANPEARNEQQKTPLIVAANANNVAAARALIAAGADVNARDALNDSAYLYSGAEGHAEILGLTLANGADVSSTNRYGGTALIPASEHGHVEAVRMLIDAGVDVDHVNNLGWTALIEAVLLGADDAAHRETASLLLAAGANPNLADAEGNTPLRIAENKGFTGLADLIRAAGGTRVPS